MFEAIIQVMLFMLMFAGTAFLSWLSVICMKYELGNEPNRQDEDKTLI